MSAACSSNNDGPFRLRLFKCDYYTAAPVSSLDPVVSPTSGSHLEFVPVIRVFGSTPNGQTCCLHVHGVLPYFYVRNFAPYPSVSALKTLCTKIDEALKNTGLKLRGGHSFVHSASVCRLTPFYGYHAEEEEFWKLSFCSPSILKKASELLQDGRVSDTVANPYELHIPYVLQFMVDYNLYGMDVMSVNQVRMRFTPQTYGPAYAVKGGCRPLNKRRKEWQSFHGQLLNNDLERQSRCELEVDCSERDIIISTPSQGTQASLLQNPGLRFIWLEELMRHDAGGCELEELAATKSLERTEAFDSKNEKYYFDLLDNLLSRWSASHPEVCTQMSSSADMNKSVSQRFSHLVDILSEIGGRTSEEAQGTERSCSQDSLSDVSDASDSGAENASATDELEHMEMSQQMESLMADFQDAFDNSGSESDNEIPQVDGPPGVRSRTKVPLQKFPSSNSFGAKGSSSFRRVKSFTDTPSSKRPGRERVFHPVVELMSRSKKRKLKKRSDLNHSHEFRKRKVKPAHATTVKQSLSPGDTAKTSVQQEPHGSLSLETEDEAISGRFAPVELLEKVAAVSECEQEENKSEGTNSKLSVECGGGSLSEQREDRTSSEKAGLSLVSSPTSAVIQSDALSSVCNRTMLSPQAFSIASKSVFEERNRLLTFLTPPQVPPSRAMARLLFESRHKFADDTGVVTNTQKKTSLNAKVSSALFDESTNACKITVVDFPTDDNKRFRPVPVAEAIEVCDEVSDGFYDPNDYKENLGIHDNSDNGQTHAYHHSPGRLSSDDELSTVFIRRRRNVFFDKTATSTTAAEMFSSPSTDAVRKHLFMPLSEYSQIEGPTVGSSLGALLSNTDLAEVETLDECLHVHVMSMEVHAKTRGALRPDPLVDAITAIFYAVYSVDSHDEIHCGWLFVGDEYLNVFRPNLQRYGHPVILEDPKGASDETSLLENFVDIIERFDPDILTGYEIQMLSWGYLFERAEFLKHPLVSRCSRIPLETRQSRSSGDDHWWAMADIEIAGRVVLNLWHLMRNELDLTSYTLENIAFHLLRLRVPLFSFRNLSAWYDDALQRWRVVDYYLLRVVLELRFLITRDLVHRTAELARLFGIQFFEVLSRGSQFRVESMLFRMAKEQHFVLFSPNIRQRAKMAAPECLPLVMEPESQFYTDPVVVLDFQSLYPSISIAYNYCYSTCLGKVRSLGEDGILKFGCGTLSMPLSLVRSLRDDLHVAPSGVLFVKKNIRLGILPQMLDEILQTRLMVKRSMKEYKNSKALLKLLNYRQLGLKMIANVTYGYTAANFSGRMPCVEIADSIVHKGRETLEKAIELVNRNQEWGGRVVYGDTDSMFVLLSGKTKEEAFAVGAQIASAVTQMNPYPVKLKLEKVYLPCILQTKKRYAGYMYESPTQTTPTFDAKGIETVRRDTCPAVAKMLEKSLKILFDTRQLEPVRHYTVLQFQRIFRGHVPVSDFIIAKEYRGQDGYKENQAIPALRIARRRLARDRRSEPRIRERVPYVVIAGEPKSTLISCVREPEELMRCRSLRLNYAYYVLKQICPALNRMYIVMGWDTVAWYRAMPRSKRPMAGFGSGHRPSARDIVVPTGGLRTLSQYFKAGECLLCGSVTTKEMCTDCEKDQQKSIVRLIEKIRKLERSYSAAVTFCSLCSDVRHLRGADDGCVSLDCPMYFRRVLLRNDMDRLDSRRYLVFSVTPEPLEQSHVQIR